jgi:hypothetical protein
MERINKTTFPVARISKKQNFETDNSASSGGGGKYVKYLTFSWPLLEATLSIFNVRLFC